MGIAAASEPASDSEQREDSIRNRLTKPSRLNATVERHPPTGTTTAGDGHEKPPPAVVVNLREPNPSARLPAGRLLPGEVAEDESERDGAAGAAVEALRRRTARVTRGVQTRDGLPLGVEHLGTSVGLRAAHRAEGAGLHLERVERRLVDRAEHAGARALEDRPHDRRSEERRVGKG